MSTAYRDLFLRACRREPVSRIPVWYMRQAGRYQPEYREIRKKYTLEEICRLPEVCAEVTLLPIRQMDVDAAILFSDIMVPVEAMGLPFEIRKDIGPIIDTPIRSVADVDRLRVFEPEESLPHVLQTIQILRKELHVPLIGFAGAPFTLASYMIEGGPSDHYLQTKAFMLHQPAAWHRLMDKLADMIVTYMRAQVAAGASAVQIFDSWVGALSPDDYAEYVMPAMVKIFAGLRGLGAPCIYFGVGAAELIPLWKQVGADVMGIDWRLSVADARARIGHGHAIQGNLDPAALLGPWSEIERRVAKILEQGAAEPGFVFNLGHGVFPSVEVATLQRLTEFVHSYSESILSRRG